MVSVQWCYHTYEKEFETWYMVYYRSGTYVTGYWDRECHYRKGCKCRKEVKQPSLIRQLDMIARSEICQLNDFGAKLEAYARKYGIYHLPRTVL